MPDNPHASGQHEASFMLAAEVAIRELRAQANDATQAAEDAKKAAARAENSRELWRRLTIVLSVALVLLGVTAGVTGYFVNQTRDNTNALRQQAIASCVTGNAFRSAQTQIWEKNFSLQAQASKETAVLLQEFISVLANGDKAQIQKIAPIVAKSAKLTQAETAAFLKFVRAVNAPRDCGRAFAPTFSGGHSPTSGNPRAQNVAVTWTVVQMRNWGGACLTAANAAAGTHVTEVNCGSAHNWVYGSNGQLSLQGHTDTSVGDSGGWLALKSPGSAVKTDAVKTNGPSGFTYDRLYFGLPNTYWHANGIGSSVTLISNPGSSLAVYYAFLNGGLNAAAPGTVTV